MKIEHIPEKVKVVEEEKVTLTLSKEEALILGIMVASYTGTKLREAHRHHAGLRFRVPVSVVMNTNLHHEIYEKLVDTLKLKFKSEE